MSLDRAMMAKLLVMAALLQAPPARATTYQVGAGKPYPTLASLPALKAGDLVEISPGTYHEVKRWTEGGTVASPIIIRGVGSPRPVIDAKGLTVDGVLPRPRAVFQIEAANIVIENLVFMNARNGNNGAGIRVSGAAAVNTVIRGCKISDCDMGVMSDSNDNLLIESTEIAGNGTPSYDGYSHNLYLGGGKSTLRYCYIHDSPHGQNVKSRGHYTELLYNYIGSSQDGEVGLVDGAETALPSSNAVLIGNIIVSKPRVAGYNSARFILFGQDSGGAHAGTLYAINNTFVAGDSRISFLDANTASASIVAINNIFHGSNKIGSGKLSGASNWLPAGAAVPAGLTGSLQGADPGLVNLAAGDYHLTASSPCRDAATAAPTFVDGSGKTVAGVPTFEYLIHLQGVPRASDGKLDLGAHEYGGAVPADRGPAPAEAGADQPDGPAASSDGAAIAGDAAPGDGGAPPPPADGCGCGVTSRPELAASLAFFLLFLLGGLLCRRRRGAVRPGRQRPGASPRS